MHVNLSLLALLLPASRSEYLVRLQACFSHSLTCNMSQQLLVATDFRAARHPTHVWLAVVN